MKDELRNEFAVAGSSAPPTGPVVRQDCGLDCWQKAVIALDFGAKQVRKSENSHFSRILAFSPFFRWNPLPCNPFQLKQTGAFLGFPEKFSGGGIWGGWKGRIMKAELRNCKRSANGVVKTTQPRVTRLTSQAPSQSVAVSRSDFEEGLENAKCYSY